MSQFQNNATETVRDWAVRNPNAAQGAEALGNIAKAIVPVTKGAEYARTRYDWGGIGASTVKQSQMGAVALPKGKAPVGENFSQAQQGRYSYDSPYHSAPAERNWNSPTANKMSNPRQYRRQTAKMSNWQTKATRRPGCRLTVKDFRILKKT